jgi:L-lactate dehydrogenase complex protein LldG
VHSGEKQVETENSGRERILQRIQTALRAPAKRPATSAESTLFSPVSNPLERFQLECAANNTECVLADGSVASAAAVSSLVTSFAPGEIFVQDEPSLRRMGSAWNNHAVRWSSEGAPQECSQATITLAEWLVAETGSVFVSSSCGGRAATVAAPVHIVVASVAQLVPDLTTLFLKVREKGTAERNSMLCLITGSSRTADIEKTLVMGAHGPRRLIVVVDLERN